jgi:hypothetical protein
VGALHVLWGLPPAGSVPCDSTRRRSPTVALGGADVCLIHFRLFREISLRKPAAPPKPHESPSGSAHPDESLRSSAAGLSEFEMSIWKLDRRAGVSIDASEVSLNRGLTPLSLRRFRPNQPLLEKVRAVSIGRVVAIFPG